MYSSGIVGIQKVKNPFLNKIPVFLCRASEGNAQIHKVIAIHCVFAPRVVSWYYSLWCAIESIFARKEDTVSDTNDAPRHVAVIMDGNGRWAKQRGLRAQDGHRAGTENIRTIIETFAKHGVQYLTLYAFSTENWKRSKREIDGLMRILGRSFDREVYPLHRANVRLRHIGKLEKLPTPLRNQVEKSVRLTRNNTGMTVCLAFDYGGRAEIVDAVRSIVNAQIPVHNITEQTVENHLYTHGIPDPDLVIRTGGEKRVSNFLLWQSAYAEYIFYNIYWPEFNERHVQQALAEYAHRTRTFGNRLPRG
ncbi:MAG: di-trans,poly-cis-decaprenylcistransferase [Candidatus Spechtbacteria bacterium SB0662_bin_43]|uniref:Isoprenyl transferase n=1 Tax=Candidatus Spechtbacteria bacterium SB0662_bin_43 TaxID=2604897 RepID=A0A845DDM9_9BACT|nr:di-trans,poly-cis-decaprenylcistransferase [Candidatus Spechtbacteria bacterium SB0662_bin_43]